MTRINAGYSVKRLTDKHLLAEHREIKRIPNMIKSGKAIVKDIPEQFTMGTGHVKFFYNKLKWLLHRYNLIYDECLNRGFKITPYYDAWVGSTEEETTRLQKNFNDWEVTPEAKLLIEERINSKLNTN